MPAWCDAVLLGLIEGITEFLPISSTGHLLLAQHVLRPQSDLFNTVIQVGAVLAVLAAFAGKLRLLLRTWRTPATQRYVGQLAVSFGLTAVGGLGLKAMHLQLPETIAPVAWATLIGGILLVLVERRHPTAAPMAAPEEAPAFTWPAAVALGLAQLVAAVFPGTSRSGVTILAALALGISRGQAVAYAFLLGVPTIFAAASLQLLDALRHPPPPGAPTEAWDMMVLATVVAGVTAFVTVRWLLSYVTRHSFVVFGWYRIALGLVLLGAPAFF